MVPVAPITPPSVSQETANRMLSETSNALVSLRQAQLVHLTQGLVGIHQRLGEVKQGEKGNVWVRNLNSRSEFDPTATASDSHSSGFKQDYHGIQVGADTALSDNFRIGGFVGHSRSTVDFNGNYGEGKLNSQGVGIYVTYQGNNGIYVDNIAKYDRLKSQSNGTGSRHYNAFTLSSEIGKQFNLADHWTVTPNAQLAWSQISGSQDEQRLSSVYSRIGLRVAKGMKWNSWSLQPYGEINGVMAKNHRNSVRVNQHAFNVASSDGGVETALGLNAQTGNHRFGIEAKTSHGKRLAQPFAVQAIYRYQW
ncbi:pertactin [Pasteurellaceae bacterium Macca]|nr:pertactin [Pasteurellaceae bacterium Macca]